MRSSIALVMFSVFALSANSGFPASTAEVRVKEERPGLQAKAKIPPSAAMVTARAKLPRAELVSAEIEQEHGQLIYSFDFKTKGKRGIDEVNIDATSGTVLKIEHESPKTEAKEKAADSMNGASKKH
jgi:uncharacterized membrane protein YkoI